MRRVTAFDMPLFLCTLILVGLGIVFIFSASYPKALIRTETGGDAFFYTGNQIKYVLAGLVCLLICAFIRLEWFYRPPWQKFFFWGIIAVMSLCLLLVLIVGNDSHGNKSWLWFFQPSEFAKVAVVITLASYLARRPWTVKSLRGLWSGPIWFLIVPVGFIVAEQDLGTAFAIAASIAIILVIAGVKFRFIGVPMLLLILGLAGIVLSGHRVDRIDAWRNPEDRTNPATYQPLNSLIAVGSGGLFGRGFCQSRQKWFYLPAAQNDSIMAIIAEESGFLLTVLALFLPYLFLVFRGFSIAHRAPDEFGSLLAIGCTVMLATQAIINMSVVMNVIPAMGINLPFVSSGGSSIVACMMMAGLLLNVSAMRPGVNARRGTLADAEPVVG